MGEDKGADKDEGTVVGGVVGLHNSFQSQPSLSKWLTMVFKSMMRVFTLLRAWAPFFF